MKSLFDLFIESLTFKILDDDLSWISSLDETWISKWVVIAAL